MAAHDDEQSRASIAILVNLGELEKLGELERLEELDNNRAARQLTKPNACPFVNLSTCQLAPSSTNHLFSL